LRKVYVDGFILRYLLIEWVRAFDRAVFYACSTPGASALANIARFFTQPYGEIPRFSFDGVDFGKGQNLYVGMPADLDQFG
jgi:hypothetical protein